LRISPFLFFVIITEKPAKSNAGYFPGNGADYGQIRKEGYSMDMIALILSVIGCINWGLVGLFRFDLVAWLFGGAGSIISRVIYTLVGLAGLWCVTFFFRKAAFRDAE